MIRIDRWPVGGAVRMGGATRRGMIGCRLVWVFLAMMPVAASAAEPTPLFLQKLAQTNGPQFVAYTPSELDPRDPANQSRLKTSSIQADLEALRPVFSGLVLYGYHEACTPRIMAIAEQLQFEAILLAVWDVKSAAELDGVAALAQQAPGSMAVAICVGNEGLTFGRYEEADLAIAEKRLRWKLGTAIPLTTSEPLVGYERPTVQKFGDFLAPNIHPVFDRKELGAAAAANWTRQEAFRLAKLTGRSVLVKETGFPHGGDVRYSPEEQAAFWRAYRSPGLVVRLPDSTVVVNHAVAFEAFDLPWKSAASMLAIEACWGLRSATREPRLAWKEWASTVAAGSAK
jgi:exo-beta-1,3-glucanase (GH17 family)